MFGRFFRQLTALTLRADGSPEPVRPNFTEKFGVFAPLFETSAYLELLNLGPHASDAVSLVVTCCRSTTTPYAAIWQLLREIDWRPHLVAGVALWAVPYDAKTCAELWIAIDRGSWVTPQLAVMAFLRDPDFCRQAQARIEAHCPVDTSRLAGIPGLERHVMSGPTGGQGRSGKMAASLVHLLKQLPQPPDWPHTQSSSPDLAALLAADKDSSGRIAEQWLKDFQKITAGLG